MCNFKLNHLEPLWESAKIKPQVNQIEVHPLCFDQQLYDYCKKNNIQIIAHTPLAKKSIELWNNLDIMMLAKKYKVQFAQIILNWTLSKGIAVIPRSQNYDNIRNNSMLDFTIEEDDIKFLDSLNRNLHISKDTNQIR